jgi:PAS domain S-box-containing protein
MMGWKKTEGQLLEKIARLRKRITELEKSVDELNKEKKMLEKNSFRICDYLESNVDIIYSLDVRGQITYISPAVEKILGYKPEEVKGKSIWSFLSKSEFSKAHRIFRGIIKAGRGGVRELSILRKDGSVAIVEINSSLGLRNGRLSVFGILRDITKHKPIDGELRKTVSDLHRFNRLAVARELKMIELKKEVNGLLVSMGCKKKYRIPTSDSFENEKKINNDKE